MVEQRATELDLVTTVLGRIATWEGPVRLVKADGGEQGRYVDMVLPGQTLAIYLHPVDWRCVRRAQKLRARRVREGRRRA